MRVKFKELRPSDRKGSGDAVLTGYGKVIFVKGGARLLEDHVQGKDEYGLPIEYAVEIEVFHEGHRSKVAKIVQVVNLDEERRIRLKEIVEQERRSQGILLKHLSATAAGMGLSFEEGEKEDSRSASVRIEGVWVKITQYRNKVCAIPAQKVLYTDPQHEDFELRMSSSETFHDFVERIMKESPLWAEWEERIEGLALEKGISLESAALEDDPKFPRTETWKGAHFDLISGELFSTDGEKFAFTFRRKEGEGWELSSWMSLGKKEECAGLPPGSYSTAFGGIMDG